MSDSLNDDFYFFEGKLPENIRVAVINLTNKINKLMEKYCIDHKFKDKESEFTMSVIISYMICSFIETHYTILHDDGDKLQGHGSNCAKNIILSIFHNCKNMTDSLDHLHFEVLDKH